MQLIRRKLHTADHRETHPAFDPKSASGWPLQVPCRSAGRPYHANCSIAVLQHGDANLVIVDTLVISIDGV